MVSVGSFEITHKKNLSIHSGCIIGFRTTPKYKSMLENFQSLDDNRKKKIVDRARALIGAVSIDELMKFVANEACKRQLVDLMTKAYKSD